MASRRILIFPMLILGASLLLGCGKTSKSDTASEGEKGTVPTMPPAETSPPQSAAAAGTMPVAPATTPQHSAQ